MGLSRNLGDFSQAFNSLYKINLDMSGWDRTTIEVTGGLSGRINLMGSNNDGQTATQMGNAQLAVDFYPVQATNLGTGAIVNAIYGNGLFEVPINAQFLRLQGSPASAGTSVYRLTVFNSKIS